MSKMLWELELPVDIALAKEDLSKNNIWKYMRYFNMYLSRYRLIATVDGKEEDISYPYFSKILFGGRVGLIKDPAYGLCVGRVVEEKQDPTGKITKAQFEYDNGKVRTGLAVGKDLVIAYSDMTRIPPILYLYTIAQKINIKESIIDQQDNMLRKPIIVTGEGEDFDNAMNNANNVLSGIEWINTKPKGKGGKKTSILDNDEMKVLNLQLGNAYKGSELWDSRKHYEELLCEYMGYTTVKNEKKERMNTSEVNNDNSIGKTLGKSAEMCLKTMIKDVKEVLGINIRLEKVLEEEKSEQEEVTENGSNKNNMGNFN